MEILNFFNLLFFQDVDVFLYTSETIAYPVNLYVNVVWNGYIYIPQTLFTLLSSSEFLISLCGILILLCLLLLWRLNSLKKIGKGQVESFPDERFYSDKNLLISLIDNLPDFIYIKDENSRFIVANKKLANTFGYKNGKDIIGKTDHDFYPKKMADEFRKNEIEVMVTDSPILFKIEKVNDENNRELYVNTSKIPLHDENDKVIGIVGIGRDITDSVHAQQELENKNRDLREVNTLLEEKQEEIMQQQEELNIYSEKLLEEKNLLRSLIDNLPDRIYIKDRKSRFITGNINLSKILKVQSPDDLIGKTDFDLHPKKLADEFYKDEQKIMSSGISLINKEESGKDIDGNEAIISTSKVPLRDEFGNVIGIVGIGREITKYKQTETRLREEQDHLKEINVLLEEQQEKIQQQTEELHAQTEYLLKTNQELEKLSLVASKTDNAIIIMDAEGNFEWVNYGFEQKTKMDLYHYSELKGNNLRQNSNSKNINEILDEVIKNRKPKIYSSKLADENGNDIWYQTTISPILNEKGDIVRLIAIDSDITLIKEAENKINIQKHEIEQQRDELRKLNTTKDKFFSIIAHDLKNPFHSIMGFSDLLSRSFDDIDDNRKKEFLKLIKDSSTSAYALLENLLCWARTQTNQIKFEPSRINLIDLIEQNIQILNVSAMNKEIKLTKDIEDNPVVFGDVNMLNAVLRNLINNSIKFTQGKGKVSINTRNKNGQVIISVNDNGIGMDEDTLSKLFRLDVFHNASGTSGETGTGLGLIVCKEFLLRHSSELLIKSKKDQGSTFSFALPIYIN